MSIPFKFPRKEKRKREKRGKEEIERRERKRDRMGWYIDEE